MANIKYTLKVINLLQREANAKAGLAVDYRLGKSALTIEQLELLEDQIEAEITRPMVGDIVVTERGEQLAREIHDKHFAGIEI